jgi:hypothetical protein
MIDTRFSDDWSDDDELDDSFDDADDDDSLELVACPECGEPIYEEAEQCPACGSYVIHRSDRWGGRPPWWVILGFLGAGLGFLGFTFLR